MLKVYAVERAETACTSLLDLRATVRQRVRVRLSIQSASRGVTSLLRFADDLAVALRRSRAEAETRNARLLAEQARLQQRLELFEVQEHAVPGDGNCQFASVCHQLDPTLADNAALLRAAVELRAAVVHWLREHANWRRVRDSFGVLIVVNLLSRSDVSSCFQQPVQAEDRRATDLPLKEKHFNSEERPAGATPDEVWAEYCQYMSVEGHWGDNLTLTAIAELKRRSILIISSADAGSGGGFVFELDTTNPSEFREPILLCHWAEYHYGSLQSARPNGALMSPPHVVWMLSTAAALQC